MGYGGTWAVSGPPSLHGQVKGMRSWLQANLMNLHSSSWVNVSRAPQKSSMCWSVSISPTWYMVWAWGRKVQGEQAWPDSGRVGRQLRVEQSTGSCGEGGMPSWQ